LAEEKGTGKIKEGTSAFSSTKILAEHKVKEGDTLGFFSRSQSYRLVWR
jgi:hypothetical protein